MIGFISILVHFIHYVKSGIPHRETNLTLTDASTRKLLKGILQALSAFHPNAVSERGRRRRRRRRP